MNAIDLLKKQHQTVKRLFHDIEEGGGEDGVEVTFEELANNLAAHSAIEEKIFYPAAYEKKTKAMLTEAVEEHLAIKRLVADLMQMTRADDNFDAKIVVLKEQVEHHVEEEESDIFKSAKKELGVERLKELGAEMESLFEEEMAGDPADAVPEQTKRAAPLPSKETKRRASPRGHGHGAGR